LLQRIAGGGDYAIGAKMDTAGTQMRFRDFVFFLLTATLATISAAMADPRDDVLSSASRCSAIPDYRKWLDCYYGAAQPMRALLGLPPASEEQQRLSAGVRTAPSPAASPAPQNSGMSQFGMREQKVSPEQFGLAQKDIPGNTDHIAARMTDFTLDRLGNFTATLSNGQIWRQESGDNSHVRWEKSAQKMIYNISIERGALGSYNFHVQGQPGTYKVERLR
jgi:hypothetical protein